MIAALDADGESGTLAQIVRVAVFLAQSSINQPGDLNWTDLILLTRL